MSLSRNYLFTVFYQVVSILTPFITTPYITRVLGGPGIGINAFTDSVLQVLLLFGSLGLNGMYSIRAIAYIREDMEKRSRVFWEIFFLKGILLFSTAVFFISSLFIVSPKHNLYFFLQTINILSAIFDISWFFIAVEEVGKTVIRNLFVKLSGIILIFLFVKTPEDLWKFILILVLSGLFGSLSLWTYVPGYIRFISIRSLKIKEHFLLSLKIFIPQIGTYAYVMLDKTMTGIFSTESEVGNYDIGIRITKIALTIITSSSVVLIPRLSNLFTKGDFHLVKNYILHSFHFATYTSLPLMFGLIGISYEFVPWFLGPGFEKVITIIIIVSPIIPAIAYSNVIGSQFLIPASKERELTISVITAAIISISINIFLIPKYSSIGTSISILIAEFIVIGFQLYYVRNFIQLKGLFYEIWKNIIASTLMLAVLRFIGVSLGIGILTTCIQVISGGLLYIGLLFLLKSKFNLLIVEKLLTHRIIRSPSTRAQSD